MGVSKLSDIERPRLGDHIFKHPLIPSMHAMDPADNLPRPVSPVSMTDTLAPALTLESFVCMGDESVFVVRDDWGAVQFSVEPDKVRLSARLGAYYLREAIPGLPISGWEPRRPQCEHYRRVMTSFEGDPEVKHVERVCTAQRGESGEHVSLNDTEVFACEHREPRDFVSEERLRRFDAARLADAKKSEEEWEPDEPPTRSLKGTGEKTHGND